VGDAFEGCSCELVGKGGEGGVGGRGWFGAVGAGGLGRSTGKEEVGRRTWAGYCKNGINQPRRTPVGVTGIGGLLPRVRRKGTRFLRGARGSWVGRVAIVRG